VRLIIGLLFFGAFRIASSQSEVVFDTTALLPKPETCNKAIAQANEDGKSNIFKISRGPIFGDEYERFYRNYMVTKFGIEVVGKGCLVYDFEECYNDQMHKLIRTKYKDNFLIETEEEIKEEFEIFKTLDHEQRKKYIDFNFTYKIVDQKADFILGRESLIKELHNRVDFSKIDFSGKTFGLFLVIGRGGTVDKCEVISKNFPRAEAEKIENAIKGLGSWTPARLYGFDVKSEKMIGVPISITQKTK